MKTLIVTIALISSFSASAACNVTLKATKENAKSAKLNGVSFSAKQIVALKEVCEVKIALLNIDEQVELYKARLQKKIAKLEAKNAKAN